MSSTTATPRMAPEDKAALSALKLAEKAGTSNAEREKAKAQTDKAAAALVDPAQRAAFARLAEYFLTRGRMKEIGKPLPAPLADIMTLGQAGWVQTAEFAWGQAGDSVLDFPLAELLTSAPSARMLEPAARKHRDLTAQVLALLLERPEIAETSAAFDWLAQRAKTKDLAKLASQFLSGHPRRRHLPARESTLVAALLRDKAGDLLQACLPIAKNHPPAFDRLWIAVTTTPKLLTQFIAGLPKAVTGPDGDVAMQLLESWLPAFPKTSPVAREELSGVLINLAGLLLRQPKRKEAQSRLLDALGRNVFPWLLAMEESQGASGFWLVARAEDLAQARKPSGNISHYGAGLLASSMEKAKGGLTADALLEALALNLGMEQVTTGGENVSFDPNFHEDTIGGLLAGDPATVSEPGWRLGDLLVRRAKVTPQSHA
ncbi:MAG: hypothetical protein ABJF10_21845 [Chthoniobacter sp.]|uniref:hypothetical protein n=1 Tax=Chthoniobacter sp. TaxID=2510640 RepID=UPI0032A16C3B